MKENLDILRHSCAHILAQAVCELYPHTKLGIGPPIEEGFYYDFDLPEPISEEDLPKIERKMHQIIKQNLPFRRQVISKEAALKLFNDKKQPYKIELLKELGEEVTIYEQGGFVDLCLGPHLNSTGEVPACKLLSVAGAYWRGDEKNPMLTRIYGTAFFSPQELDEYLSRLEEAKRRDHRKLMTQLEITDIYEEAGPGLVFYHPDGTTLRDILFNFLKEEHKKRGYQEVVTPHIAKAELWERSGHAEFYKENMYFIGDKRNYVLKPMNCPFHILIYSAKSRSFKELPLRIFELGTVYRKERSGVLHGLLRVCGFTQDDAHIFCTPEQLEEELTSILDFVFSTLRIFGFSEYLINLSTQPEKYAGNQELWEKATSILKEVLYKNSLEFKEAVGEGVFYGPKIDIQLKDALGRLWQAATLQLDFVLPSRFDLYYIGKDGKKHTPVMIHRVILGSIERFLGTLLEHYGGNLPFWLAPTQVMIITISADRINYGKEIEEFLRKNNIRVKGDYRNRPFGKKLYEAQVKKIPYILIIGEEEEKSRKVAIRQNLQDKGKRSIESFLEEIRPLILPKAS